MGVWIVAATVLFLLGSFMALKPGGVDVRLDKLRMTARKHELNPKVVVCPDWIRGRNNEFGRGMLGQYALVLDKKKFSESYYQVIEGQLRPLMLPNHTVGNFLSTPNVSTPSLSKPNFSLDGQPLNLPSSIAPFIKGVYSKANYLVVFWDEADYVKPLSNPNFETANIESDLISLKSNMCDWADKLS